MGVLIRVMISLQLGTGSVVRAPAALPWFCLSSPWLTTSQCIQHKNALTYALGPRQHGISFILLQMQLHNLARTRTSEPAPPTHLRSPRQRRSRLPLALARLLLVRRLALAIGFRCSLGKRLRKVGDDVVDVLCADGDADEVL